ncbi:hypothetical protein TNCT_409391 [Trichonephila clavata]|uniref:Uncharacterized protein n=1 Tax=Trichonephila clavata TaxID=2740835 RepID=A0A8X6L0C7_TRICU|nr:hypothetical protein TNCT_409391 [Trichonephila clavata]
MMGIYTASCVEISRVEGSGPLDQSSETARVFASKPRESASAGLHSEVLEVLQLEGSNWKSLEILQQLLDLGNSVGNECFQQMRRAVNPRQGDRRICPQLHGINIFL